MTKARSNFSILFSLSILLLSAYFVFEMFENGESVTLSPCLTSSALVADLERVCKKRDIIRHNRLTQWNNGTLIPRRLHQTFLDTEIPNIYHEHIKSWIKNHPDWEYYFWTDRDAERMIRERYPQYIAMFESYKHRLMKSDAIRYFVLHQFGGVYADMDVHSLKPIEPFLRTNTCVIVPEPYVQTKMLFNRPMTITNAFMASTANHPFLTYLIEQLPGANRPYTSDRDVLHATGPFLLNTSLLAYNRKYPLCMERIYCHVYTAHHKYFMPRFDTANLKTEARKCRVNSQRNLGLYELQACEQLNHSGFANPLPVEAYTDHFWLHLDRQSKEGLKTRPIKDMVSRALLYDEISKR